MAPGDALKLLVVFTEGAHRLPNAPDHQRIERPLPVPGQGPQLRRQGEGQQKIVGGHLFVELALQPLLTLVVLAVGTIAMTAGVRHEGLVVALGALHLHRGPSEERQPFMAASALRWQCRMESPYRARNSASKVLMIEESRII